MNTRHKTVCHSQNVDELSAITVDSQSKIIKEGHQKLGDGGHNSCLLSYCCSAGCSPSSALSCSG